MVVSPVSQKQKSKKVTDNWQSAMVSPKEKKMNKNDSDADIDVDMDIKQYENTDIFILKSAVM